ncbi:hypothetical protein GCM10010124_32290 [Pilimelia terevasa]|uniref:Uncharacterized protein n=1 Tax=Pilimelia terevasa TaxID=53372 RepID=A0A8J3BQU2_9ACTN|nr:hypothetical protein [Pilimelia terevasa]GGK37153.1 hypothetical protein GCM10010124_32290 [Pilimelia terevasa]
MRLNDTQLTVLTAAAREKVFIDQQGSAFMEGSYRPVTATTSGLMHRNLLTRGRQYSVLGVHHTDLTPTEAGFSELAARGLTADNDWTAPA